MENAPTNNMAARCRKERSSRNPPTPGFVPLGLTVAATVNSIATSETGVRKTFIARRIHTSFALVRFPPPPP